MTLPWPLISGPPELPWLMAASVWMTFWMLVSLGEEIVRLRAETMPVVTVCR